MKKIAFIYLAIILAPLEISADIIFFKDGMKTVCRNRAWEEGGNVKCEYDGTVLTYQKTDVLRIEKINIEEEIDKPLDKGRSLSQTTPGPVKLTPVGKLPVSEKKLKPHTNTVEGTNTTGLEFYNPRRPQKYWTSENDRHNTFKEAVSALAKAYDRSQEWVQQHMGDTNNLNEIHQNLSHHKSEESSQ